MIVAWVKDWNLLTYLQVVSGANKPNIEEAYRTYQWLPTGRVSFKNKPARRFIADNMPSLNNKLWDAKNDKDRLSLYRFVMAAKVGDGHRVHFDQARSECRKERNALRKAATAESISVDMMRKGSGHHWNVCK